MQKHFYLFIGFLFSVTSLYSQSSYTTDIFFERLPIPGQIQSSQVNEIIEDKYGLLWIASDGLYRYDGYTFKVYTEIAPNKTIAGKEIIALWPDKNGNKLYIGTHSYGLVEYDYATDKFSIIPTKKGFPIISLITQTDDGTLWCGSFSNGLYYLKNDSLVKLNDPNLLFNNPTYLLAVGNKLYVDKLKNVFVLKDKIIVDTIPISYPGHEFPHFTRITAMSLSSSGSLWIGTERAGVLQYDTLTQKFIKYFPPDKPPFYHRINRIISTTDKKVWILTKANGLVVYDPSTDSYQHLTKNPLSEQSLGGNNCSSIVQDKNGIVWVGATGDLNKYDPGKIKFRHINNNPFGTVSLNDNMVRSVYEDQYEKLWIGTDGGVIHIFDRKSNTLEKIQVTLPGVTQHIVPMCFQDLDDNIMLVGTSFGFLQFNRTTKKISFYKPLENLLVKNRLIRQIIKQKNIIYFIHTGSLFLYNIQTKQIKSYSEFGPGIINATVIYIDSKERLWVGGRDGISLYNEETESFKHFAFENNPNRPLGSYFMVLSIIEHQSKLWVGTFNTGLWSMELENLSNPIIKNYTTDYGLPDNTIYASLPDSAGNLWLSTNKGIAKFKLDNNQSLNFNITDGIQHEEFNRLAFTKCRNGEMVFGGINGINIFNPEQIVIEEKDYTPTLLGISFLNQKGNYPKYISLLNKNTLTLEAEQNNLEVEFFIPNYRTPKRYDVLYKLSSFNQDWVKVETNQLYFPNLDPGEYELKIKTISDKGIEKETEFLITIKYPFWQTWWFLVFASVLIASAIYWLVQYNISKARHDKEQLEKLLRLRTQEIEKSREELANLNQKKDVIFSILSHDLRSPLTTLKGFLSILIDSDNLSKDDIKRHATSIRNSVTSSLDLIDNTLFWSLSQTGNITYTPTNFSINSMLKKISNLYALTIEKKQIVFSVNCKEELTVYADENMIYVALRNLVANAIKFTSECKSIVISANEGEQNIEISVKDEGIGMSEAYLEKLLNEEHLQVKMGTSNEKGTGLGIVLCKRFIALNHGDLTIRSEEGKGSEFILTLPKSQELGAK